MVFVLIIAYIERTQLIRAKVPILRFREKGRYEQKGCWCIFFKFILLILFFLTISTNSAGIVNITFALYTILSDLEFDLNVNNTVGIRNTFLLRSYAYGGCE